jgi:hypothetical protein
MRLPKPKTSRVLLCGAALALALSVLGRPTVAQQGDGLRGAFPAERPVSTTRLEGERRQPLQPQVREPLQAPERAPLPAYRPVSAGALPEERASPAREELLGARPGALSPSAAADQARREQARRVERRQPPAPVARPASGTAASAATDATGTTDPRATGTVARPSRGLLPPPDDTPLPPNTIARGIDAADLERNIAAQRDAERAGAIEARQAAPDATPFAATGVRVGTFLLRPSLEQGVEWSSNASATSGGSSDVLSSTTARLAAASEWSRHSLSLDAAGTWRQSLRGTGFSEVTAGANAALNLELGAGWVSASRLNYDRRPETASLGVDTVGRPLRQTFGASTGLQKTVGPLLLSGRVSAERNVYDTATLAAGGVASQADRNNTLASLTLRGGYAVSPGLQPFAEAEYGRRMYDVARDGAGNSRAATRLGARAGLAFDRGEKLTGEISAGLIAERPDNAALAPVAGLSVDANVVWSPLRGTQVTLAGNTGVDAASLAGTTGALVYGASIAASRELTSRLTGSALLSAELRRYAGSSDSDTTLGASGSLTWWLNRHAGITGRASYETQSSTLAGRGYNATTLYFGLTLQR